MFLSRRLSATTRLFAILALTGLLLRLFGSRVMDASDAALTGGLFIAIGAAGFVWLYPANFFRRTRWFLLLLFFGFAARAVGTYTGLRAFNAFSLWLEPLATLGAGGAYLWNAPKRAIAEAIFSHFYRNRNPVPRAQLMGLAETQYNRTWTGLKKSWPGDFDENLFPEVLRELEKQGAIWTGVSGRRVWWQGTFTGAP